MVATPQYKHENPTSFLLKKNDNVFQEVVSKDPILKSVVDLNRNDVGHYRHYYKNGKEKTSPSKI